MRQLMVLGNRLLEWCETAEPKLLQPTRCAGPPVALRWSRFSGQFGAWLR